MLIDHPLRPGRLASVCGLIVALGSQAASQLPDQSIPPGNPITLDKLMLGKALFWDEQLSATGTVACGTCHMPSAGGSDPRSSLAPQASTHPGLDGVYGTADDVLGSPGVVRNLADASYAPDPLFGFGPRVTTRKAPSFINAGFAPSLFWDGRAKGQFVDPLSGAVLLENFAALETQAAEPPIDAVEMGHEGIAWSAIPPRIEGLRPLELASDVPAELAAFVDGATYQQLFEQAFGPGGVTPARIAMALASYQRKLVSDQAKILKKPLGFTQLELDGGEVFANEGRCVACHKGLLFTDHSFRNTGVRPIGEDRGLGAFTGKPEDDGKFRVPSLLNVGLRAPLFHNGGASSLAEVIEFYDRGGDFHENQDPKIEPLGLSDQQKLELLAYLGTFDDPRVRDELPPFDRPTLYSESGRVPVEYGLATPGSGGFSPDAIAIDPASITNTSFALGLNGALGGAPAILLIGSGQEPAGISLLGVSWFVALDQPFVQLVTPALEGSGAGQGYTTTVLDLSALAPTQIGQSFHGQWAVLDTGSPGGLLSASEAFALTIF